jgi:hypothetical protein
MAGILDVKLEQMSRKWSGNHWRIKQIRLTIKKILLEPWTRMIDGEDDLSLAFAPRARLQACERRNGHPVRCLQGVFDTAKPLERAFSNLAGSESS